MPACLRNMIENKVHHAARGCLEIIADFFCTWFWLGYDRFYQERRAQVLAQHANHPKIQTHSFGQTTIIDETNGSVETESKYDPNGKLQRLTLWINGAAVALAGPKYNRIVGMRGDFEKLNLASEFPLTVTVWKEENQELCRYILRISQHLSNSGKPLETVYLTERSQFGRDYRSRTDHIHFQASPLPWGNDLLEELICPSGGEWLVAIDCPYRLLPAVQQA